ncbi:MAG: hypothetical protein K0R54_141 [Clostridiaceae bacterium]|jgi:hypothetical protein|nr:hypothetical protein [Clostridiaceae bacterium]
MRLIDELGKQIINPVVGLYLDNKLIQKNTIGEIHNIDNEDQFLTIIWKIDNKEVYTKISTEEYQKLKAGKIIDYLQMHIAPPIAKFNIGDMVESCSVIGIIRNKGYDGMKNKWVYSVISIDDMFSNDYEFRYQNEEEDDLKLVETINATAEFKNKKFSVTIEEIKE